MILLDDNARPHVAKVKETLIEQWEVLLPRILQTWPRLITIYSVQCSMAFKTHASEITKKSESGWMNGLLQNLSRSIAAEFISYQKEGKR